MALGIFFMSLAIYATAHYGDRRSLGWLLIAAGERRYLLYPREGSVEPLGAAPVFAAFGTVFLGLFDRS